MSAFVSNISYFFELLLEYINILLQFITGNPVLYFSVLAALAGGVLVFAIGVIRKFGVRGLASSGRRRRRRG